jgi:VanZ family protein
MLIRWIPVVLVTTIIFIFSSQPYKEQNIQPWLKDYISEQRLLEVLPDVQFEYAGYPVSAENDPYGFVEFFVRKAMHVSIYASLGLAFWIATRKLFWAISGVILIASLDEWNQASSVGRTGTPFDVMVDLSGALIVLTLLWFLQRKKILGTKSVPN